MQRRSTEEFESLPYVVKLLNGYMWVYYGVVKPNSILVATVNGFGSVLELIYVIIFLIFAPPRMRVSCNFHWSLARDDITNTFVMSLE